MSSGRRKMRMKKIGSALMVLGLLVTVSTLATFPFLDATEAMLAKFLICYLVNGLILMWAGYVIKEKVI